MLDVVVVYFINFDLFVCVYIGYIYIYIYSFTSDVWSSKTQNNIVNREKINHARVDELL